MKNRKFLYGYCLRNGRMTIQPQEADTVRNIVTLYMEGVSFQKIAETLDNQHIPYSEDAPLWNKHKVKRLLENPRYAGADGYPAIIETAVHDAVQEKIRSKTSGQKKREIRPALWLKPYLRCEDCGGPLIRIGETESDTLGLRCQRCGNRLTIRDDDLIAQTVVQLAVHASEAEKPYTPSEEVIRLTNAVNRGLEQPKHPEEITELILKGISARYDCCPSEGTRPLTANLNGNTLKRFSEAASHITVSKDGIVTVCFLEEKGGEADGAED
ncbi:MAG: recombinase family protein [Oscillibacter sp.]|nr:recombinase family protein [Oscillibacter sp.]